MTDQPEILYRIADGQPFYSNKDGTYGHDRNTAMRWTYNYLMATGLFTADEAACKKRRDE